MNPTHHAGRKWHITYEGKLAVDLHLYGMPLHEMKYRLWNVPVSECYDMTERRGRLAASVLIENVGSNPTSVASLADNPVHLTQDLDRYIPEAYKKGAICVDKVVNIELVKGGL